MKTAKKRQNQTRGQLLEAACLVFAEKGYRDATIAGICRRAGANIAAVNYHFRDKETLYAEAWRIAFQRSLKAHPADGGVPVEAQPEQRFRGRILTLIQRFADPASHELEMINKEMANPTGLLAEVMRECIRPIRQELGAIVRELLGPKATDQQVLLCLMSIRSQCFDRIVRQRRRDMFTKTGTKHGSKANRIPIEQIADHVSRFSLAGIRDVRRQIETDTPGQTE